MKQDIKRYIIRKYVLAKSALDAIRQDKGEPVHDVWVDTDYKLDNSIGFTDKK